MGRSEKLADKIVCKKATDLLIIGASALVRVEDGANVSQADSDEDCNYIFGTCNGLPAYIKKGARYYIGDDVGDDTYFRVSFALGGEQTDITENIEQGVAIVDADSVTRHNSDALKYGVLIKDFVGTIEMQSVEDGTEAVCGRGSVNFEISIINKQELLEEDQDPLPKETAEYIKYLCEKEAEAERGKGDK